uniref:Putative CE4: related to polysaccharide deacetylase n=1 Tax=Magnetococcus massalia (strain MO-1) TaxID=451514 RepID=A0A1S7LNR2_MAGMO|nr:Putative CE4 : related to polysaccharide deacetylase [Candidatus Magnetococcus massalia]
MGAMVNTAPQPICNAFTVDVEDYYQVCAFESHIDPSTWPNFDSRVEASTERILGLMDEVGVKGTFFTLGCVAARYPQLVRRIVDNGHELASHGYAHVRVTQQDPLSFRHDVDRTRKLLEDIGGFPVIGYRASTYSITQDTLWALEILRETGHLYSSSIYPIKHDLYGMPEAPRFAHRPRAEGVMEIPAATVEWKGVRWPCGGGGWFRLLPYPLTVRAIARINRVDEQPLSFYCHPWEVDPDQPRIEGISMKTRFRHYLNLHRTLPRLSKLLRDFSWDRMDHVYRQVIHDA